MHRRFRRPTLDMPKPSQTMLDKLLFNWCHSNSPRITSFRIRSFLVWPHAHLNMRISATPSCWTCRLLVGQHSAPYNIAGRIAVLQNLPFSFCGTLLSQRTPEALRHFSHPTLI